ncbi:Galactose oxidase/kelch, beta-propeller [Penicillium expansum]|uniref:Galactose oxidase/kelch, beta-propeller n=1 Tax=Penicillium expansum TaxID=27334 RepID=A0A0A2JJ09_PENEN|nr:Galactose oxidase/kelch, beta-propeller [Penicillium expansum]KGO47189.1 Galactose oxidase/kelch, beta-propeller [Penicillium expansum]KGO52275.1 Galactose oxidase/kelch, beta-propeller [Penicillium expansum]KGO63448.1 Galactose oxidase/kelch, beta-propeller [Penicillium expansum]
MKVQWAHLLVGASFGTVNAMSSYMMEAMNSGRVSGYGKYDNPSWQPLFNDESPPYQGIRVPRTEWKLQCSTSRDGNECQNAIDGTNTTSWYSTVARGSHNITIDMKKTYTVNALVILPPLDAAQDQLITEHEVYISKDGESWKGPVAYGMWPDSNRQRMAAIEPVYGRYVRLVANAQAAEPSSVGISELNIYATLYTIPQDPKRGIWGPTVNFPVVPVSGAQEASGNIVLWSSWASDHFHSTPGGKTVMSRWNPLNNTVSKRIVTNTQHDMFCPGISIDGTGLMVVTGGNDASETSLYNSTADMWVKGPPMRLRRGYQASATMSDGRVFVIGGSWAGGSNVDKDGEIWDPYTQTWTLLTGASVKPMLTNDMEGPWRADNHAWLFGWKKNTIFQAGPSRAMNWYYTEGKGNFKPAGDRRDDDDAMSGNAVMFDAINGKILTFGGSPDYDKSWATSNAHIITIGEPGEKPTVRPAGQNGVMHYERVFHTSVVLPDGKVFIAGGQTFGVAFNEENVQFVPEIYDPETDTFIQLQENNFVRVYHTISILLPDGRVLNGGGGLCGNCSANHYDAQIFTPPYLLTETGELRTRPEILSGVPEIAKVGGIFAFQANGLLVNASLVRLCTTTHTVNTDQRRIPLRLIPLPRRKSSYGIRLPDEPGILIPGYWMLFVIDQDGVPSIAKTIMITVNNKNTLDTPQELLDEFHEAENSNCEGGRKSYWPFWKPTLIMQILRRG